MNSGDDGAIAIRSELYMVEFHRVGNDLSQEAPLLEYSSSVRCNLDTGAYLWKSSKISVVERHKNCHPLPPQHT